MYINRVIELVDYYKKHKSLPKERLDQKIYKCIDRITELDVDKVNRSYMENTKKIIGYKEAGIDFFHISCKHDIYVRIPYDNETLYEYIAEQLGYELYDEKLYSDKSVYYFRPKYWKEPIVENSRDDFRKEDAVTEDD